MLNFKQSLFRVIIDSALQTKGAIMSDLAATAPKQNEIDSFIASLRLNAESIAELVNKVKTKNLSASVGVERLDAYVIALSAHNMPLMSPLLSFCEEARKTMCAEMS